MDDNEKYVRDHWDLVHRCDGSYRSYPRGTVLVQDVNGHWSDFDSWENAAQFTRDRLEEIRQVEDEITWIEDDVWAYSERWDMGKAYERIVSRLQSVLEDSKRGMK